MEPIVTNVPGRNPIQLVAYYPQFLDYYPNCELETKQWFVQNMRDDWITFDCGANIGYYSILFSCLSPTGHVFAFEPTVTSSMLLTNLQYHGVRNVEVVRLALGSKSGLREDRIFKIWGTQPERAVYEFVTIDDFVRKHGITRLDCIKIDTDSYDFEVLQGARQTIASLNPFIMVELNYALAERNQTVAQALGWLLEVGYTTCTVFDGENFLLKRGFRCASERAITDVLKEEASD